MDSISVVDGVIQATCDDIPEQQHDLKKELVEDDSDTGKKKLSHKQWRRYLKKMRRKNARQILGREKERKEKEEEQRKAEECSKIESEAHAKLEKQLKKEARIRKEKQHQEWLEREKIALLKINNAQNNNVEDVNIILGGEMKDDQKVESTVNTKKELLQKEMIKLEKQQGKVPQIITYHNPERPKSIRHLGDGNQTPLTQTEYEDEYESMLKDPNICKFFMKTGACRYGLRCSRSHVRCENSSTIMIPNFFQNASLEIPMINESCADAGIEYDEMETLHEFEKFYEDVIEEFKTAGNIVMFKCCQNYVPHLRGNVYVQFSKPEYAMEALKMFNGRFYAGRQLSVELSPVSNWKSSICGMFLKDSCPRGKACNFLHVFRNPGNAYSNFHTSDASKIINDRNQNSHSLPTIHRRDSIHRRRHRSRSRSRSHNLRSRTRSRSRSPRRRRYTRSRSRERRRSQQSHNSNRSSK